MTKGAPTAWFDGQLKPCTMAQFVRSLRRLSGYADREFGMRSDPAGLIGERLNAAADVIEHLAHGELDDVKDMKTWPEDIRRRHGVKPDNT